MNSPNQRWIFVLLTCCALFQVFFLVQVIVNYDILLLPPALFRVTTIEEWYWLTNEWIDPKPTSFYQVFGGIQLLAIFVFTSALHECVYKKKYRNIIGIPTIIRAFAIGGVIYLPFFVYNKYFAPHYRLYMHLIIIEVLSLILAYFLLKLLLSSKENGE